MSNVIWKAFKLGDLYNFDSSNQYPYTQKQVDLIAQKDSEHDIAVIAQSEKNNGIIGYINRNSETEKYTCHNLMTFSMNFGICFYHSYDYLLLDTHGSIFRLTPKNDSLSNKVTNNLLCNLFLAKTINKICSKSLYDWQRKPNSQRTSRELILLPCLEVSKEGEYIWEEDGRYFTLHVEYIEKLMKDAKKLKEEKTIKLYEAERAKYEREKAKYEREKAKYESGYKKEKQILVWKAFKLGDLYNFDSSNQYPYTQKQVDLIAQKDSEHDIAVIAQSEKNNGIIGYINRNSETEKYTCHNLMTFSMNFGICFYHSYDYLLLDTHGSIFRLTPKNDSLSNKVTNNLLCNLFLAKTINKICSKSLYDWQRKPNSQRTSRELILLPCLEVSKEGEYIWEEDGRYFTLAVDYIAYIYLSGRAKYNEKLIDKYEYKYQEEGI